MKQILKANISFWHFSLVLISSVLLCTFLYVLAIPIGYWLAFGEGAKSSRIDNLPINIFIGNWGALILILLACSIPLAVNFKQKNFQYAKSYLITIIIVFIFYLFRLQIGDLIIT